MTISLNFEKFHQQLGLLVYKQRLKFKRSSMCGCLGGLGGVVVWGGARVYCVWVRVDMGDMQECIVYECKWMYSQSHLGRHFRKLFQSSKLKAQSSNVSFH